MNHNTPTHSVLKPQGRCSRSMAINGLPTPHQPITVANAGRTAAAAAVSGLSPGTFGSFLGDCSPHLSLPDTRIRPASEQSASKLSTVGQGCVFTMELDGDLFGGISDGEDVAKVEDEVSDLIATANQLAKPLDAFSESLEAAVKEVLDKQCTGFEPKDLSEAAVQLASRGFNAVMRSSTGGFDSRLRHGFIQVLLPMESSGGASDSCYIVDPNYKELFQVAAVSRHTVYNGLLKSIPDTFVGTRVQLKQLILFLCDHLGFAFEDLNVSMPPWRGAGSYLSLWSDASKENTYFSRSTSPTQGSDPGFNAAWLL